MSNHDTDTERAIQIRLTGSHADVFAAATAIGATCPGGWHLEVRTSKHRDSGLVQLYGRLMKRREATR
jgi:hypothetical protein